MHFKSKTKFIFKLHYLIILVLFSVIVTTEKSKLECIKVLINKMYKNTNLRYETQSPMNKNTITKKIKNNVYFYSFKYYF